MALNILAEALKGKKPEVEVEVEGPDMGLETAAQELVDAINAGDAAGVAAALRNAFELMESEPHEEAGMGEE